MRLVEFSKDDPTWLTCPHCRGNNLYHGSVTVFTREHEDGPVTARTVTGHGVYRSKGWAVDDANPSSRRGGRGLPCHFRARHRLAQGRDDPEVAGNGPPARG
jgi:hypothetical protein